MIGSLGSRVGFMLDHLWAGPRMSAYLDGELEPAEGARLERHTHDCPDCHRALESLRRTIEGLRRLRRRDGAPEGLADVVIERLRSP